MGRLCHRLRFEAAHCARERARKWRGRSLLLVISFTTCFKRRYASRLEGSTLKLRGVDKLWPQSSVMTLKPTHHLHNETMSCVNHSRIESKPTYGTPLQMPEFRFEVVIHQAGSICESHYVFATGVRPISCVNVVCCQDLRFHASNWLKRPQLTSPGLHQGE